MPGFPLEQLLRRTLRGKGASAIHWGCMWGLSSLLSHDVVSAKAKGRDKRYVQEKGGDRTAGKGAARVTDWEQV